MSTKINSTNLCIGSYCLNGTDIQSIKDNPVTNFVCSGSNCLNASDIALIKNLPNSVNSTRHCIGPDCMISSDLVNLKTLPSLVNSSSICSGSTCLNSSDVAYLKTWIANTRLIQVQELTNNSIVSTYAGSGTAGYADGPPLNAMFKTPSGLAVANDGTVFVVDRGNHMIRRISPEGVVSTVAGSGAAGFADGQGTAASFSDPHGITIAANGSLFVTDTFNHRIRMITPQGYVSTVAGSTAGFADGNRTTAQFNVPHSIQFASDGSLYISDHHNHRIRRISPLGIVSTVAGNGQGSSIDGQGASATFKFPKGLAIDQNDIIFISDGDGDRIRRMTTDGQVTTLAGSGNSAFADGQGTNASFSGLSGVAVSSNQFIYVTDWNNYRIRKITYSGLVTTIAGTGSPTPFLDGFGSVATISTSQGVTVSPNGTLFVSDFGNNRIRRISNA
jgi:sugar lactone lactonase YvrE